MTGVSDLRDKVRQSLQVIVSASGNMADERMSNRERKETAEMVAKHVEKIDALLREDDATRTLEQFRWRPHTEATDDVKFTAAICRPKLGQACAQACMGAKGDRYAFVFDNPGAYGYHWLQLPRLPGET